MKERLGRLGRLLLGRLLLHGAQLHHGTMGRRLGLVWSGRLVLVR